jgi:hypothetical protein
MIREGEAVHDAGHLNIGKQHMYAGDVCLLQSVPTQNRTDGSPPYTVTDIVSVVRLRSPSGPRNVLSCPFDVVTPTQDG